jgi:cob(I)alamin adenosyltransferase
VERGLVQVYTGEGKGKTTAAVGLAVRALGQGLRVLLVRLLKPAEPASGEVLFLQGARDLEILTSGVGIVGGGAAAEAVAASVGATFAEASRRIVAGAVDLAVLDEVNNAVHRGYLPLAELLSLLERRPSGVELVLTGRHAHPEVLARADLVTRMEKGRHPLDAGIAARAGIEY